MSEENKKTEEEILIPATPVAADITPIEEEDDDEDLKFSALSTADDELPEEIKQKLEKNKQARAKKKLVKKKRKKLAIKWLKLDAHTSMQPTTTP